MEFKAFQEKNWERNWTKEWPPEIWALAIAGEAGELANLIKKVVRGDFSLESQRQAVLEELADVISYCDLMMTSLEADTETELVRKFNIVSERIGSSVHFG